MKTTIDLDDDLLAAVRARAKDRGTTMRAVIEESIRRLLLDDHAAPPYSADLPVTHGTRRPTIDVNSNAAIDDHLDRTANAR